MVTDELTEEEERERQLLERQVERAFYLAGRALRSLRDRRLYRSTHKTFEEYCLDRFGMKRAHYFMKLATKDAAAYWILNGLGKLPKPYLTPVEEKLLSVLETEYGLKGV